MAVRPGEDRHLHTAQWPHPGEVSGHPREGLPGVPRKARPEAPAASAPGQRAALPRGLKGPREQGHGPLHDKGVRGIPDLLPLSPQSFGAASGSGRAPERTESDLLYSLAEWGLGWM